MKRFSELRVNDKVLVTHYRTENLELETVTKVTELSTGNLMVLVGDDKYKFIASREKIIHSSIKEDYAIWTNPKEKIDYYWERLRYRAKSETERTNELLGMAKKLVRLEEELCIELLKTYEQEIRY